MQVIRQVTCNWQGSFFMASFKAMASPCEILLALPESQKTLAVHLAEQMAAEVWRIEDAYSRYFGNNLFSDLHASSGKKQQVNAETARLLNFAEQAWHLSDGLFDLTSGLLRKVWVFDGSDRLPDQSEIDALLPFIGWQKLSWQSAPPDARGEIKGGWLTLPEGIELDFGGIGKEYAADRALGMGLHLLEKVKQSFATEGNKWPGLLVNLGGDLACSGPLTKDKPWQVGVESLTIENTASLLLQVSRGGLATSGDSRRFLLKNGKRYSHLLNPLTGWPVEQALRSVSVAAPSCVQAGLVASLALLQGADTRSFLAATGLKHWVLD